MSRLLRHKVLLLSSAFNGLTQRVQTRLVDQGHHVHFRLAVSKTSIQRDVAEVQPSFILCPFLTRRIPESVCNSHPCLVLHPGIVGDGGPSALDWALHRGDREWGVTLLQAEQQLDGGPVWSSRTFRVPDGISKAGMYRGPVSDAAVQCVDEFLAKFKAGISRPKRPDELKPEAVRGIWRDKMPDTERTVNFFKDSTASVLKKIRFSDSSPGARGEILGRQVLMFGAHPEDQIRGDPGRVLATRNGAVCIGTSDGAVWVSHLRDANSSVGAGIKLQATRVLGKEQMQMTGVEEVSFDAFSAGSGSRSTFKEIWYEQVGHVGVLHFDFHNGAMSTDQCRQLTKAYKEAKMLGAKVLVLQGGKDFFSNGIHLNVIEAAPNSPQEAWENICAIDDLVREILCNDCQVTVSAVEGNAGAGGVFLALAADHVWLRNGCVLNPHYKAMGLYGSEYWTHSLPRRVGPASAKELVEACLPISSERAYRLNMADSLVFGHFDSSVMSMAGKLASDSCLKDFQRAKNYRIRRERTAMEECRSRELDQMRSDIFDLPHFEQARKGFVLKAKPTKTPDRLLGPQDENTAVTRAFVESRTSGRPEGRILRGKSKAESIIQQLAQRVEAHRQHKPSFQPQLAIVQVGDRADSSVYIRQKMNAASRVGIQVNHTRLPRDAEFSYVMARINELNDDPHVDGLILQMPLDSSRPMDLKQLLDGIAPEKDVDGLSSINQRRMEEGLLDNTFIPCAPLACIELIKMTDVAVKDSVAVVIGLGRVVGGPIASLLRLMGARVVLCDIDTTDIQKVVASGQIVISATGVASLVREDWVQPGAVVVDFGCNEVSDSKGSRRFVGDVCFEEVAPWTSHITPVPGGAGPLTVAMLMRNVVDAAFRKSIRCTSTQAWKTTVESPDQSFG